MSGRGWLARLVQRITSAGGTRRGDRSGVCNRSQQKAKSVSGQVEMAENAAGMRSSEQANCESLRVGILAAFPLPLGNNQHEAL